MTQNVTTKQLSQRISERLASFKLRDDVITKLANRVLVDGLSIAKFDICIYGICIDYFTNTVPSLAPLLRGKDIAKLEVFPYGIIEWDRFHVRVGYTVNELEGRGVGRGFAQ